MAGLGSISLSVNCGAVAAFTASVLCTSHPYRLVLGLAVGGRWRCLCFPARAKVNSEATDRLYSSLSVAATK